MRDGQDWLEWVEARRLERIERSAEALRDLAGRYARLDVTPIRGAGAGRGRPGFGPRTPLRVPVVDAALAVEAFVRECAPRVWDVLGLGQYSHQGVRAGLVDMADNLPGVYPVDAALGGEIAGRGWRLRYRVGVATGDEVMPQRLQVQCPECEAASLWWAPDTGEVRCANPECGCWWDVLESAVAYSSTTGDSALWA